MKKILHLAILLLIMSRVAIAQQDPDSVRMDTAARRSILNKNGNQRAILPGVFSGFVKLLNSGGNSLTLNSSLWNLEHLGKTPNDADYPFREYLRSIFLRNFQINGSLSPDNKSQLQMDSAGYGVKYALINNNILTRRGYNKAERNRLKLGRQISNFVNSYGESHHDVALTDRIIRSNLDDSLMPGDLEAAIKEHFHITGRIMDTLDYKVAATNYLARVPVWTVSFNHSYNLQESRTNEVVAATDLSVGVLPINGKLSSIDLSLSYKWQGDTIAAENTARLNRNVFSGSLGIDLQVSKRIEIKPDFSYVNIQGPLYKKESARSFNGEITFRYKVNDQWWLPVSLQYTPHNGQILGFLSVQYSL